MSQINILSSEMYQVFLGSDAPVIQFIIWEHFKRAVSNLSLWLLSFQHIASPLGSFSCWFLQSSFSTSHSTTLSCRDKDLFHCSGHSYFVWWIWHGGPGLWGICIHSQAKFGWDKTIYLYNRSKSFSHRIFSLWKHKINFAKIKVALCKMIWLIFGLPTSPSELSFQHAIKKNPNNKC